LTRETDDDNNIIITADAQIHTRKLKERDGVREREREDCLSVRRRDASAWRRERAATAIRGGGGDRRSGCRDKR